MADDTFVTQTVVEFVQKGAGDVRATQTAVEYIHKTVGEVRASQVIIEIIRSIHPYPPDEEEPPIIPGSGLYELVPGKRNDTLYTETRASADVKIPNPRVSTTYFGS